MQLGGRTTTEVSRTVRVGGLRGLRHARRGGEGRRQRRGGLQPPPHAQTDPHGTARRDAARRRAERADREQHPLVDTLARRPAALDGQPRRGGLRTRVVSRREHLRRRAHARIFANRYVPMLRPDGVPVNSVSDAAVHVGLRLSKNETVYRMPFDKQSMGSVYPS